MPYTAQELARVKREAQRLAREDTAGGRIKGIAGAGLTMRVPREAFFAAIDANGGVRKDGTNIWHDKEWVRDQRRLHPEIDRCPDEIRPSGMRNRFGRVSERIFYPRTHP